MQLDVFAINASKFTGATIRFVDNVQKMCCEYFRSVSVTYFAEIIGLFEPERPFLVRVK